MGGAHLDGRSARRIAINRGGVSARDRILFTRQLATLLGAGIALDRALSLIAAAPGAKRRARLAAELSAAVNRGESLSAACRGHPGLPAHYAMVIGAGEAMYERWRSAHKLCLDCTSQKVLVVA